MAGPPDRGTSVGFRGKLGKPERRHSMKRRFAVLLALAAPAALAQQAVPTIAFDSPPEPLKLPAGMHFGELTGVGESGKQLKQFGWIHEIACPSENLLYVAE